MAERRLIAVAVRADGTISPHAGRAKTWVVFDAAPGEPPAEVWRLDLTPDTVLHEWHVRPDPERHPLHRVDVAIAGSGGDGVMRRLKERGVTLVLTAEPDPVAAITGLVAGTLPDALPHEHRECLGDGPHEDAPGERPGMTAEV